MKLRSKLLLACGLMAGSMALAAPASAVVVFLSGAPVATPGGYEFSYQGNFSAGEGIETGSTLVIFDFAGYVPGSIFSPYADVAAAAELTSGGVVLSPDFTDDPSLYNLRFTYNGATTLDLSNVSFGGLSAKSFFNGVATDGFAALTVKTAGPLIGSNVYSSGLVSVPTAVPEPAMWAMMLSGFGMAGSAMRRRRTRPTMVTA